MAKHAKTKYGNRYDSVEYYASANTWQEASTRWIKQRGPL